MNHYLNDGQLVLYKRQRSNQWQGRIRIKGMKNWQRFSTKTDDIEEAKTTALKRFSDIQFKLKNNLPLKLHKFSDIAEQFATKLEKDIERGTGKPAFFDYIRAIRNKMNPFFNGMSITQVDESVIAQYEDYLRDEMGREPSKNTFKKTNVVLRSIFEFAIDKKYCTKDSAPAFTLKNKGKEAQRRPCFDADEWQILCEYLNENCSTYDEKLLREYVLVLANTGMRPGLEPLTLRWKDIEEITIPNENRVGHNSGDDTYICIWVNKGKTKERQLVARHEVKESLARLKALTGRTNPGDLVFCAGDGASPANLAENFFKLLNETGLLYDRQGRQRVLYSLRHTYATFRIIYQRISYEVLAKQMGTSVAMIEKHYSHLTPKLAAAELAA